jgi:predicted transcriptional regulator
LRRPNFEVLVKLLRFTEEEKRKTKIMSHCNLGYTNATNIIDLLLRAGLLDENRKHYRTTAKGSDFIEEFGKVENIFITKISNKASNIQLSRI